MNDSTTTLGFHLSANPAETAVCAIDWNAGAAEIALICLREDGGTPLDYKFIKTAVSGIRGGLGAGTVVKTAIDAPLGWPEPFVQALATHHSCDRREEAIYPSPARYGRRETDRFVRAVTGRIPPSTISSRRGAAAMHCAAMLIEIADFRGADAVERTGTGLICEAYPDSALRFWTSGDPRALTSKERYRGVRSARRRHELVAVIQERSRITDPRGLMQRCVVHDQCLDALVCALVARAVWLGKTLLPDGHPSTFIPGRRLESLEGWIHLPNEPLVALLGPGGPLEL